MLAEEKEEQENEIEGLKAIYEDDFQLKPAAWGLKAFSIKLMASMSLRDAWGAFGVILHVQYSLHCNICFDKISTPFNHDINVI